MFRAAGEYGDVLIADSTEGEFARKELAKTLDKGHWLHNQQGKILGFRYNDSPIVIHEPNSTEPAHNTTDYFPSTWPGVRPPHFILENGKGSIFDTFGKGYTLVDFTRGSDLAKSFDKEAKRMGIPFDVVELPNEANARRLWEQDVVLIRPDGHVAWRSLPAESNRGLNGVDVAGILKHVSGN